MTVKELVIGIGKTSARELINRIELESRILAVKDSAEEKFELQIKALREVEPIPYHDEEKTPVGCARCNFTGKRRTLSGAYRCECSTQSRVKKIGKPRRKKRR